MKRGMLGVGLLCASAALLALAVQFPPFVEHAYARGLYPAMSLVLSGASSLVPLSLAELLVLALVLAIGWRLLRLPGRARSSSWPRALGNLLADTVLAAGLLVFAFVALWGLNYRRLPLAQSAGLDVGAAEPAELRALVEELVATANRLREGLPEDEEGVVRMDTEAVSVLSRTAAGFDAAERHHPWLGGSRLRPKPLLLSEAISWLGITGIYSPFTGEPNVNLAVPAVELPFAASHEAAHQRGIAREDEANFVAYLVSRAHPDRDFNYSGALAASIRAVNALYGVDHEAAREANRRRSEAVRRDLAALRDWAQRHEGRASRAAERVNDAYLRSQGQKEGVRSYGRMVDLLLAERRAAAAATPAAGLVGDHGCGQLSPPCASDRSGP